MKWLLLVVALLVVVPLFAYTNHRRIVTTPIAPSDALNVRTGRLPEVRVTPSAASRSRALRPTPQPLTWVGPYDITAYTATGHRTASGRWPEPGMVASNRWPMGTRLRIEGLGEFVVQDRVGGGTDVDVFVPTRREAIMFGRKHLHVAVIR